MLVYKTVNLFGGNLQDRFVDANLINKQAAEGWKLIAITAPPNCQNNRWVSGTFVRDEVVAEKVTPAEPKRVGRPPKVAAEEK